LLCCCCIFSLLIGWLPKQQAFNFQVSLSVFISLLPTFFAGKMTPWTGCLWTLLVGFQSSKPLLRHSVLFTSAAHPSCRQDDALDWPFLDAADWLAKQQANTPGVAKCLFTSAAHLSCRQDESLDWSFLDAAGWRPKQQANTFQPSLSACLPSAAPTFPAGKMTPGTGRF
jgi:hypothetical protein